MRPKATTQKAANLPGQTVFRFDPFQGVGGAVYAKHPAVCLETQYYPDSVNHTKFPSTIVRPGKAFKSTTVFKFSAS